MSNQYEEAAKKLEEAIELLKSIKDKHGIAPATQHYIVRLKDIISSDNGECGLLALSKNN